MGSESGIEHGSSKYLVSEMLLALSDLGNRADNVTTR